MLDGHEMTLLAGLMNGKDLAVTEGDFAPGPNRLIYRAIASLNGNRSPFPVQDELLRRGELPKVGGHARLTHIYNLPTTDAVQDYALLQVLDASRQRHAAQIVSELQRGDIGLDGAVSSFNSLARSGEHDAVEDFPEPLSDVAFQGLAGDLVRRIEPHTEADRAALLIQILTAFGNVIGHDPFAMADGSRHAMNLFCVLVGESSKSRKGTSQQHVLRVFGHADQNWREKCIVNGLSSGEGLIWAVHDEITRTVEDKKTGERKTELVDAGIADKRLCVTEGEFANVLKVITREGNTLSPVIRASWDSGNLRTLTKNSPACATDAHISIVGHITNCQLRRLLTETESANGFGNRFLWLAVRRSKCLPEGGNIDAENLNDLIMRLHTAIEFARNASEVTRDDESRELWRIVYPELSEGKPGLVGAITARAEAQVLRLSAIYALLDCSTKIRPEHHRAALALWNYCDRSAKWIFGTTTGNPYADQILVALRAVGAGGMTETEMSNLFHRNVPSGVLADARRVLHQSGQIKFTKESTGGAPRKRWFATKT